jgi:hypothetical protein
MSGGFGPLRPSARTYTTACRAPSTAAAGLCSEVVRASSTRLVAPALALVATLVISGASAIATATKQARRLHDARYCEILELRGTLPHERAIVWNTIGLGRCPARWWNSLDASSLAHARDDVLVVLNGPRHFLMDSATAVTGPRHSFRGQRLTMVASVPIHTAADLQQTPYTERTISRTNTWRWNRGRRLFELLAPGGKRYIMQSYAQIKDRSLTLARLPALGPRLRLPPGWRYRTRKLTRPLVLSARRSATIIQDELQDTYQLAPPARAAGG